jgi:starch phosphorylase
MRRNNFQAARQFTRWRNHLQENWYNLRVLDVRIENPRQPTGKPSAGRDSQVQEVVMAGEPLTVTVEVQLGSLQPQDVIVQAYQGSVDDKGQIQNGRATPLRYVETVGDRAIFCGQVRYESSGLQGLAIRLLPFHPDMPDPYELRLMLWA